MLTEQEKAEGWIEWNGGKCPVPGLTPVDFKMQDGRIYTGELCACEFDWEHKYDEDNIVAYKFREEPELSKNLLQLPTKSLWDEYAMAALTALLGRLPELRMNNKKLKVEQLPEVIGFLADDMMAERRKRDGNTI